MYFFVYSFCGENMILAIKFREYANTISVVSPKSPNTSVRYCMIQFDSDCESIFLYPLKCTFLSTVLPTLLTKVGVFQVFQRGQKLFCLKLVCLSASSVRHRMLIVKNLVPTLPADF